MKFQSEYSTGLNFEYNYTKRDYKLENNIIKVKKNPIIHFHEFINQSLYEKEEDNNIDNCKFYNEYIQKIKEEILDSISEDYKKLNKKENVLNIIKRIKKDNSIEKTKINHSIFKNDIIEIEDDNIEITSDELNKLIELKKSEDFNFCVICGSREHLLCDTDYNLKNGKIYVSLDEDIFSNNKIELSESKLIKNTMFYDSEEDEEII